MREERNIKAPTNFLQEVKMYWKCNNCGEEFESPAMGIYHEGLCPYCHSDEIEPESEESTMWECDDCGEVGFDPALHNGSEVCPFCFSPNIGKHA